jgi:tetrahydromethanopterin S-methyltransferase subunit G
LSFITRSEYADRSLRTYPLILAISLMFCVLASSALAATPVTVNEPEHGFTLVVPEGYVAYPEGKGANVLYAFLRGTPEDASFGILQLQALGGTIGRDPLVRATVERSTRDSVKSSGIEVERFDYRKIEWRSFELELVVTKMSAGDKHLVAMTTQVPLAKEALQVGLSGPAADEAKLVSEMQAVVASVEGKSSWLTEAERGEKISRGIGTLVGIVVGVSGVLWFRRRRQRS